MAQDMGAQNLFFTSALDVPAALGTAPPSATNARGLIRAGALRARCTETHERPARQLHGQCRHLRNPDGGSSPVLSASWATPGRPNSICLVSSFVPMGRNKSFTLRTRKSDRWLRIEVFALPSEDYCIIDLVHTAETCLVGKPLRQ